MIATLISCGGADLVDTGDPTSGTLAPWKPLYQGWRPGATEDHGQYDIFAVDLERGMVTKLSPNPFDDEEPALSPDRTRVAFASADWTG